ncbi:proto-oncogene tyrosine-protein kinase ROS-like isoform X3 [Sitophilus oryzae]|uniref:Tyrosine-protein kinase receptor n=1 Tax=Sitophilus oryzae TaxID=7048 RepID=A0A6J2XT54_SITOR|nr:proto-oncogene tyrosine-protein kinase ROS-like isoform X3 [Sitophilus oryzae]
MGCNDATAKYFAKMREILGSPPAPALLDNSLEATSLKLEWRFPKATGTRLSYHIQWRYEELTASWQYSRNATWDPETSNFLVKELQPYTKYRFRVALNLGHHGHLGEPIFSEPSVVIATLASGPPASPPVHLRAAPVDARTVSVNWEPGPFPHGPLLSYVLQIVDDDNGGPAPLVEVKDVPSTTSFYLYQNLQPERNYTVSVQMRNSYGSGPPATVHVSTPKVKRVAGNPEPVLIFGTQFAIFELEKLLGDGIHLFHSELSIEGIGIHISKQLLFISDVSGTVWRLPIEQETKNKTKILTSDQIDFFPLDLSVDWLNDQLYILGEVAPRKSPPRYIIKRCNLDGTGLTVALAGLTTRPNNMEIDPCNGYLLWSIRESPAAGIYKLDISDISNGIKHEIKPEKILNGSHLGAFVVDYMNFLVLVSNQKLNTIFSVTLDGKIVTNIRKNVIVPKMKHVISLATVNERFYWTDGKSVYYEEYHPGRQLYFNNQMSHLGKTQYKKIFINLPSTQPWPIPRNPPINLQAVFGTTMAKTKWSPPHLLGLQGKAAWQNWSYEISIQNLINGSISTYTTNSTSFSLNDLTENTEYLLRVLAYTKYGKSPWSSEFRGSTLEKDRNPVFLWSGIEGLFKSDSTIENVETLIHKSGMGNIAFTGVSWYQDQLYMVSNNSHVVWYNLTSHKYGRLADMDSVGSIAVDWIGKKLYWSNLKQQLIIRSDLNGSQQEPLSILTLAKEIVIDSVKAYLYWSREYVVECAHLNGEDKMEYDHLEPFSGRQVMGLTLDMDKKLVYWVVRGSDGSHLFEAPMAGYYDGEDITKRKVALLQRGNMQGPFSYFNNRLLWLQDEKNAVVSDLVGKNIAVISGKLIWGLNLVYVVDESLHPWPSNLTAGNINVIPKEIDTGSVKVSGSSDSFNITWSPIKNVNYGVVFYEIQIDGLPRNNSTIITTEPTIRYWRHIPPFTLINVNIRAFTYWATSPQIRAEIYSPPSTPSAPINTRSYVVHKHGPFDLYYSSVSVIFRWDPPLFPNGVLQGYYVSCWYIGEDTRIGQCDDVKTPPNQTEYKAKDLIYNKVYFFQVQAFTEIGTGALSEPISVDAGKEAPLPTLLIASSDSIFIDDMDTNQAHSLLTGINTPKVIACLLREQKVFWINEIRELLMYDFSSGNKIKLFDIKGKPTDLVMDWLERSLYYVEETSEDSGSTIYKIDLNKFENGIVQNEKIFSTSANITKIEISPFTRKIYWIQTMDNQLHKVMFSDLNGYNTEDFFSSSIQDQAKRNTTAEDCNCSTNTNVESTFTIDHSVFQIEPVLIFIDSDSKEVFSSDKSGCQCNVILNGTILSESDPLKKVKFDFDSLYWTNSDDTLYALKPKHSHLLSKPLKSNDILIYGEHTQPYPPQDCLSPLQHLDIKPSIKRMSFDSLTLKMPDVLFNSNCMNTSIATVMYRIRYIKTNNNPGGDFGEVTTFDKEIEVTDLEPYTIYTVKVAASNHYSDEHSIYWSKPLRFRTSPGAPSKPQNISAAVLNPTLVQVNWSPPSQLNGDVIRYEIHWLTEGSLTGVRQKGEQPVSDLRFVDKKMDVLTTLLQKLSPNETYTVWIRAYSETNETSSDSDRVQITTYPEPSEFELTNRTSQSLFLMWEVTPHIYKYSIQYAPITSTNTWIGVKQTDQNDDLVEIAVEDLKPKNQYKFRLALLYDKYPEWYVWPSDSRFTFETLGDRPSPPGTPGIQLSGPNIYKVVWEASLDNGAPIELYKLECLKLITFRNKRSTTTNRTAWFHSAPSIEEEEFTWEQVYNGTDNSWVISDLSDKYRYAFRVYALNSYGWSDPSPESTDFDITEAERLSQKNPINLIFIATFVPIIICLTIVICFSYLTYSKRCGKQKKVEQITTVQRGPDVELATLRELPRRGIHSTNILYVSGAPNNDDITLLPHIRRDQITLSTFLGSGAFGEVYKGIARGVSSDVAEQKVAVKTLKEHASDQEKSEFLQEAQLMSHFKHEHIIQLLGVCLDNDPQFIIMELMEGGDLLTYLRNSRNPLNKTPSLNLLELLKMCLDVTKGCRYLEEMHYVHRDLACRNCLVSCVESENRIVKIGDFGLTRDIYKNDYYRKEGGGLLPVRWMAPESLGDGVFSCQSDVWAFGVLLWEIMTLGQQPYQARCNLEVLHYVKAGGRLGKPTDCPEELYKLMLQCWEHDPEKRPTFKYCLEVLDEAHREHLRNRVTGAHTQYISTVPDAGMSWKSENDDNDETNREQTPFLSPDGPKEIPKYLELLYEPESDTPLENDGYEVPNHMISPEERANEPANDKEELNSIKQAEEESAKDKSSYVLCGKN